MDPRTVTLALLLACRAPAGDEGPPHTGSADTADSADGEDSADSGGTGGSDDTGDSLGKSEVRVPMRLVDLGSGAPLAGIVAGGSVTDEDGRVALVLPEGQAVVDASASDHLPLSVALYAGRGTDWVPSLPLADGAARTALYEAAGLPVAREAALYAVVTGMPDGAGGWTAPEGMSVDLSGGYAASVAQGPTGFVPGNTVPAGGTGVLVFLDPRGASAVVAPAEAGCQIWAADTLEPYAVATPGGSVTAVALRCASAGR